MAKVEVLLLDDINARIGPGQRIKERKKPEKVGDRLDPGLGRKKQWRTGEERQSGG